MICARLVFLSVFICTIAPVLSQEQKVVEDLRLWTGAKIQKTFSKDWTVSIQEEIRFKHNISEINNYFTELGLRYRISKNFALQGDLRFTQDKKRDNSYESFFRYNFDLRYKGKIDFLTVNYRLRYQKELEDLNVFDMNAPYVKQFRNRITFKINNLGHFEPYVSAEIFQTFLPYVSPDFTYYRLLAGLRYEPGNFGSFKLAWGFNRELNSQNPFMIYMFKLNYTYEL